MARKNKSNKVTVINDKDIEGAGAVVFWNLSGATDYEALQQAWEDQGLPEDLLCNAPTPSAAMRAAEKECRRFLPKGFFTRILEKHAFAVVQETRDADDARVSEENYEPVLKVGLTVENITDDDGKVIQQRVKQWEKLSKVARARGLKDTLGGYVENFRETYARAQREVSVHNFDWWTKRVMDRHVHVVALGERGKPFYVPPSQMSAWTAVRSAFEAANPEHVFRQIPAMRGDDCIEAVMDACMREVASVTEAIYEEIEVEGDNALGKRALVSRQGQLDKLLAKMASYDGILGAGVDKLRESIEDCRATVVDVAMTLMDDDAA
jgi:hypothetical protein